MALSGAIEAGRRLFICPRVSTTVAIGAEPGFQRSKSLAVLASPCSEYMPDISLGVDTGFGRITAGPISKNSP